MALMADGGRPMAAAAPSDFVVGKIKISLAFYVDVFVYDYGAGAGAEPRYIQHRGNNCAAPARCGGWRR